MRNILKGTVVANHPTLAVTLVENHDSQPTALESGIVSPWQAAGICIYFNACRGVSFCFLW